MMKDNNTNKEYIGKKIFIIILIVLITIATIIFAVTRNKKRTQENNKIIISTTLFPQYDFVRTIAGETADVRLLLPPGAESHTFELSTKDFLDITKSDILFYTSKYMEPWVNETTLKTDSSGKLKVINLSENIDLIKDEHNHEEESEHDDHGSGHEHEYDPHIWLDPVLASSMIDKIKDTLCEVASEHKELYQKNAEEYKEKLSTLDKEFKETVDKGKRNEMVFGGRFAHLYFIKRYGLHYESAFSSCSAEMEPSVQKVTFLVDYIKKNNIPCVYYEELSEPKIAKSIKEQTSTKLLRFNTAHNISKSQFENGTTFLDLMEENLQNLKVGLN